jgi:hypothetical protein
MWTTIVAAELDDPFGYQGKNAMLERDEALAGARIIAPLGGSRLFGLRSASYVAVPEWLEIELDGTNTGGLTVTARVEVRTAAAGTSVTPKIRNTTDASDAVTGAACTATDEDYSGSQQKQTLTFTPVAGVKKYQLMIIGGNAIEDVFGIGYLEHYGS